MPVQLTKFEYDLLNRVIPTQTLSDSKSTQITLRNYIADNRDQIIAENHISESEYKALQVQSVKNIFQFLRENDFVGEREGGVNFLTEKGKNLRKQGSLENYDIWRKQVRSENKVIINTIETRGYLEQDEINRNRKGAILRQIRKFVLLPILVLLILFVALGVAHNYKLDNNVPLLKNFFDKGKEKHNDKTSSSNDENDDDETPAAKHK